METTTTESSCCKSKGDNCNENNDDHNDDVDTVMEELSVDYDDLENDGSSLSRIGGEMIQPNETSVHSSAVPCCAICLDKFDVGDDISSSMDTTKCHHEYHTLCITEWLMKHPNCPYCRRNYIPLPSPPPPPANAAIELALPSTVENPETLAMSINIAPSNQTLPSPAVPLPALRSTAPPSPAPTLPPQIYPQNRTFGYSILLPSFWRRAQQQEQELRPNDSVDIENGRITTAATATTTIHL